MEPPPPPLISERYRETRLCGNCGQSFREMDNIGRLLCCVHPGLWLCDERGHHYYSCCGLWCRPSDINRMHPSDLQGCLRLDHMATDTDTACVEKEEDQVGPLSENSITERLCKLRQFAVITLPAVLLRHGLAVPRPESVLYDSQTTPVVGDERNRQKTIVCVLHALDQTHHNTTLLMSDYNPYLTGSGTSSGWLESATTTKSSVNTIELNLQSLVASLGKSVPKSISNSDSAESDTNTRHRVTHDDSWARYDEGTGTTTADRPIIIGRHERKALANNPFIVIRRIDSKLTIQQQYSRLYY